MDDEELRDLITREGDRVIAHLDDKIEITVIRMLSQFTPHDLNTKTGREALRADWAHSNATREGCERLRGAAEKTAVRVSIRVIMMTMIAGAVWALVMSLGLDKSALGKWVAKVL